MTTLPLPSGEFAAQAQAINGKGDAAGYSIGPSGDSAFLRRHGKPTALGNFPGATNAVAFGINDNDDVVGYTDYDAFLWRHGTMSALPRLAGGTSGAADVNNLGQMVGSGAANQRGRLQFGPTSYFDGVDTYQAVAHEIAYVYLTDGRTGTAPRRQRCGTSRSAS